MESIDDWKNNVELTKYLAGQLNRGQLCLVLGAGISTEFGLPNWTNLIKELYNIKGLVPRHLGDPLKAAEDFKLMHPDTFVNDVHMALYKNFSIDFKTLQLHSTLTAIGALVMASKRGSSSKVITFNFDNILEIYLNYFGFVSDSKYEEFHWSTNADVEIFHPHGFLTYDGHTLSKQLVFDRLSYSNMIGNLNDAWNIHLLSIMMTHTCLFIGLSGDDPNLDSIIQKVKEKHITNSENIPFWGVSFNADNDDFISDERRWAARQIFSVKVKNDFSDIPDFLFSISQQAAQQRMHDFYNFTK